MKNAVLILIYLISTITINQIYSQCTPAPADVCEDSYIFCGLSGLNGYTCTAFDYSNPTGCNPLCPNGGGPHNTSWWAFVTEGGNVCISITFNNCSVNAAGMQFGVWSDCNCSQSVFCEPSCIGPGMKVACTTLDPCQTYYLFIDGCTGDVCDYTINTSGGAVPKLPALNPISGPNVLCQGSCNIKYTASLFGNSNCKPIWNWTLNSKKLAENTETISLDFPDLIKYELCVSATLGSSITTCEIKGPICKTITVNKLPERTSASRYICSEDIPVIWEDNVITKTGLYRKTYTTPGNCCLYDSAVTYVVLEKSKTPNVYLILVEGESYREPITGTTFHLCQEGTNINLGRSSKPHKCDTSFNLYLNFVNVIPSIQQYCDAGQYGYEATLTDKTCSVGGFALEKPEYAWYRECDPNKKIIGRSKSLEVDTKDQYCVDISVLAIFEKERRTVTVTICEKEDEDLPEYTNICKDYPSIQGKPFIDSDRNGHYDVGETILNEAVIISPTSGTSTVSNNTGYILRLENDTLCDVNYSHPRGAYYNTTPTNYQINTKTLIGLLPLQYNFRIEENFRNDLDIKVAGTQAIPGKSIRFFVALNNLANLDIKDANLSVELPLGWNISGSNPSFNTLDRNKLTWNNLPEIKELNKLIVSIDCRVPLNATINDYYTVKATTNSNLDADLKNNESIWTDKVRSEEITFEKLVNDTNIIRQNDTFHEIVFTMRFMNTNNIPVNILRLKDNLHPLLDPSSMRIIQSTHTYQWEMNTPGNNRITYEGINLPVFTQDYIGSQGLIQFAIRPYNNIPEKTTITNCGQLQFNCNPYIKSNEVNTRFIITKNFDIDSKKIISINPNPFNDFIDINFQSTLINSEIKILDNQGKQVSHFPKLNSNKLRVNTLDWASGIYHIAFYKDHKLVEIKKLVKY